MNKKQNSIRIYISSLGGGGTEKVCVNLCNFWVSQGLKLDLVVLKGRDKLDRKLVDSLNKKVSVVFYNKKRILYSIPNIICDVLSHRETKKLLFGLDLVYLFGVFILFSQQREKILIRIGTNPFLILHGLRLNLFVKIISRSRKVVVQNDYMRQMLLKYKCDSNTIRVIANPVEPLGRLVEKKVYKLSTTVQGVCVGRLSIEKNHFFAIDVIQKLMINNLNVKLNIFGEGELNLALQKKITGLTLDEQITLRGFSNNIENEILKSDFFFLPSKFEGQPNALLRAIQLEVPCIASGGPTVEELMNKCGIGKFYFPPNADIRTACHLITKALDEEHNTWRLAAKNLLSFSDARTVSKTLTNFIFEG